ncbi:MAG: hypothetical protein SFX18_19680 [Pirellulales bacterium]|nr:hypothetical protein [Pirellulales bacterium]
MTLGRFLLSLFTGAHYQRSQSQPRPLYRDRYSTQPPARQFESLESRTVMAGNVTVTLADGVLSIVGDADANFLSVSYQDAYDLNTFQRLGKKIVVQGYNSNSEINFVPRPRDVFVTRDANVNSIIVIDGDTLVPAYEMTLLNGLSNFLHFDLEAVKSVVIDLGGASDAISVDGLVLESLTAELGGGNDILKLGYYDQGSYLTLFYNNYTDQQIIKTTQSIRFPNTPPGGMPNAMATYASQLVITKNLTVQGQDGNDQILMHQIYGDADADINLGNGTNDFYSLTTFFDDLRVTGGIDNDAISLGQMRVLGTTSIDTGFGHNLVSIFSSHFFQNVTINTGYGNDTIGLDVNRYDGDTRIVADFAGGAPFQLANPNLYNDQVLFARSVVNGKLNINLGQGIDTLNFGKYYTLLESKPKSIFSEDTLGGEVVQIRNDLKLSEAGQTTNHSLLGHPVIFVPTENILTVALANGGSTLKQVRIDTGNNADTVNLVANVIEELYVQYSDQATINVEGNLIDRDYGLYDYLKYLAANVAPSANLAGTGKSAKPARPLAPAFR